jgi:glycosyltransferase involved in cell wall biosynthesis
VSLPADPTVTVVVPCHNYGRYLPDAVRSVVDQTFTGWELVIVDDGSTDDSVDVAHRLARAYPDRDISILVQGNAGVSAARNAGIAHARGRYILPLDADDLLAPTMLERTAAVLDDEPDIAIVSTDLRVFNEHVTGFGILPLPAYDPRLLLERLIMFYCSLYRRDVWSTVGGYDTGFTAAEDWEFWINACAHGFVARHLSEPLVAVRNKNTGLHEHARDNDLALRAAIVRKHHRLFKPVTVAWAHAILEVAADGVASDPRDPRVPDEILTRSKETAGLLDAAASLEHTALKQHAEISRLLSAVSTPTPPGAAAAPALA